MAISGRPGHEASTSASDPKPTLPSRERFGPGSRRPPLQHDIPIGIGQPSRSKICGKLRGHAFESAFDTAGKVEGEENVTSARSGGPLLGLARKIFISDGLLDKPVVGSLYSVASANKSLRA